MLDIKLIREQPELVKAAANAKGFDGSVVDKLIAVDQDRRHTLQSVEELRSQRNLLTRDQVDQGREIKAQLKSLEDKLRQLEDQYSQYLVQIPNLSAPDVKVGSPDDNEVIRQVGQIRQFDFPVRDHVDIGQINDLIDLERGAKVAQSGFYYFKNAAVLLELGLIRYAFDKLIPQGFTPVITPNVAKERNLVGCGFQARSDKERQIYHLEGEDLDLIATAEITLVGMHTDEIIDPKKLPLRYVGLSSCYRTEAGSYGKDVRGILRVHEFKKVEMVVFCLPEDSDTWHERLLGIEEALYQELQIPYQVIKMATGDLGSAASRKFDLEAWMPSQNKYREITSTSNTTDFQTRRLNIKTKHNGTNIYLHALNGTVITTSRTVIAILENYQNADGTVTVPEVLRPYLGLDTISPASLSS